MRKIPMILVTLAMILMTVTGCGSGRNVSDVRQQEQNDQIVAQIRAQTGMPSLPNAREYKMARMIYELRDSEDLLCYAYIVNLHGELIFIGQCIGYGLPYSVQFSNPMTASNDPNGASGVSSLVMPQPEPNGLYMPDGLSATWIMLIDPTTGDPRPVYFEPTVVISPFPLHDIIELPVINN